MSNKVAIVTGGARGIGAAIASRLASDGHSVAILDLDHEGAVRVADRIAANGGAAAAVAMDVSNKDHVAAAVAQVEAELGPPTVLVNNAGITRDALLFKMAEEQWDAVLDVHLKGAFLMTQATQRYMVEANWGRIINVTSISSFGNRGQINYSSAKSGMLGLTKTAAIELGRFGITVNAVGPGFIDSDMTRDTAARIGQSWEEFAGGRIVNIPVGRPGRPEDIAHAVSFFASEGASFVSGQVLWIAGGPKG